MPTFDQTFKVGFWRWLGTSFSKAGAQQRHEWRRRRDLAAQAAKRNQLAGHAVRRTEYETNLEQLKAQRAADRQARRQR